MSPFEHHSSGNESQSGASHESEFLSSEDSACDRYSLALTALFDGEAASDMVADRQAMDAEAIAAREHLSRCLRCAEMWRFWSQTRGVWRATPAAAVPSGLLLRILMACRLSALRRMQKRPSQNTAPERASLAEAFDVPPVPSHLRDAILQRTVGIAHESKTTDAIFASKPISRPTMGNGATQKARRSSLWSSGAVRWAGAVAVPAALVLMASIAEQIPQDEPATAQITTPQQSSSEARARVANKSIGIAVMHGAADAIAASPNKAGKFVPVSRTKASNVAQPLKSLTATSPRSEEESINKKAMRNSTRVAALTRGENMSAVFATREAEQRVVQQKPIVAAQPLLQTAHAGRIRPQFALARHAETPRLSQSGRGKGVVRVALRSVAKREILLKSPNRATQVQARNSLMPLPARTESAESQDPWGDNADFDESDDSQRVAGAEADQIRDIVNEYRAALLDDEDSIGVSAISDTL